VDREKKPSNGNADARLVNHKMLRAAMLAVAEGSPGEKFIFIESEPLLSSYCEAELFQILGKLAVAGAAPQFVRSVGANIHQVIAVTARSMKAGYCALLEDFLPEFSTAATEPKTLTEEDDKKRSPAQTGSIQMKPMVSAKRDGASPSVQDSAFNRRKAKIERLRGVLGLFAAGMKYKEMARFIGVGTRQRAQQLVVEAVEQLPEVARRLAVTGRRNSGRRRTDAREADVPRAGNPQKSRTPLPSVLARHLATARQLLKQNDGHYPGATEMLRLGHGALYQFKRKYPHEFQRLIGARRARLG